MLQRPLVWQDGLICKPQRTQPDAQRQLSDSCTALKWTLQLLLSSQVSVSYNKLAYVTTKLRKVKDEVARRTVFQ